MLVTMQGIAETGQVLLSSTERRLEINAHNVANASTPGFKRQVSYSDILQSLNSENKIKESSSVQNSTQSDLTQGRLRETKNPLDIAISGDGFFQVRASDSYFYTRQGQFKMTPDGTLVTSQGFILQSDSGDVVLGNAIAKILDDGTILEDGLPIAKIPVFATNDQSQLTSVTGSLFSSRNGELEMIDKPMLRQGFVESSNVKMTDEIVGMMAAIRQAETGSKLIQVYDDLMGRALSTFGL